MLLKSFTTSLSDVPAPSSGGKVSMSALPTALMSTLSSMAMF